MPQTYIFWSLKTDTRIKGHDPYADTDQNDWTLCGREAVGQWGSGQDLNKITTNREEDYHDLAMSIRTLLCASVKRQLRDAVTPFLGKYKGLRTQVSNDQRR